MGYGAGGKYPEETNPTGGGETRDESYPKGKSGGVHSELSSHVPGNAGAITTRREGKVHPRSAGHCADAMGPASATSFKK